MDPSGVRVSMTARRRTTTVPLYNHLEVRVQVQLSDFDRSAIVLDPRQRGQFCPDRTG